MGEAAAGHAQVVDEQAAGAARREEKNMKLMHTTLPRESLMNTIRTAFGPFFSLLLITSMALPLAAKAQEQAVYPTPEAAVQALAGALASDKEPVLLEIFGKPYRNLINTGNAQEDAENHARIARELKRYHSLQPISNDRQLLLIGPQAWPLPIPLVKQSNGWRFATEEGAQELLNRRIGVNERSAIYVMRAFPDAQEMYASEDRNGDGVLEYAPKLLSATGKRDGLFWPSEGAESQSPFGPLVGQSTAHVAGYVRGEPYRGYQFRILTSQGKDAAGGAFNYMINGRMLAGYAMVAYPAVWGETGVMTFIINRNGKLFEKNLGPDSSAIGAKMRVFNPGAGWKEVAP